MVKAYLRYELAKSWGVLTGNSDICYSHDGAFLITAALEEILVWNVKQATVVKRLRAPSTQSGRPVSEVTRLAASPVSPHIAAGHADGSIRLWSLETGELDTTFSGHRGAISALCFSPDGALLASGSRDTDIVVWDVGAESGLFRLRGHTGEVTGLAFLAPTAPTSLVSSSKDGLIKAWDTESQRCFQTVGGSAGEIWALAADDSGARVAAAGADDLLRWYRVASVEERTSPNEPVLISLGTVTRKAPDRAAALSFLPGGRGLICQSAGRVVDIFRRRSEAEAARHSKRRARRKAKKDSNGGAEEESKNNDDKKGSSSTATTIEALDELDQLAGVRSKHKIRSAAVRPLMKGKEHGTTSLSSIELVLALGNNSLEVWDVDVDGARSNKDDVDEYSISKRRAVIDGGGHRGDIRAACLASDDSLALTACSAAVKVWNPRTGVCLRTIDSTGYGTAILLAPGDRHAVLGTKEGNLVLIDVAAGEIISRVEAHSATIWSLCALPDGSGFVSGGGDKEVKEWVWTLEMTKKEGGVESDDDASKPRISIKHTRTLQMTDDVMAVKVSPNGKFLAVALLDATVRILFLDSFKFFLSLYGHRLPVLCMDISSDSTLIVTGSADKNIKIWGLDFGDCHRSLFAHEDSVMQVAFVPKTHYVLTSGKDGVVKYWDADKFEHLLTLEAHHAPVWALAVSSLGDWILTGSADRSLRRWEKTDEPFFIEEERERRLESLFEADLEANDGGDANRPGALLLGEESTASTAVGAKKSLESVSAADAIIEALDAAAAEERAIREAKETNERAPEPNPLLLGATPAEHVLAAVRRVRGPDLESTALLLPFADALRLLEYAADWLRDSARGAASAELLARLVSLLLRLHVSQLSVTPSARSTLMELRTLLHKRLEDAKQTLGFNLAGVGTLQGLLRDHAVSSRAAMAGHKRSFLEASLEQEP